MSGQMKQYNFQCSHSCGHGLQKRTVTCHRVNMFSWVDPEYTEVTRCSNTQKPIEVRSCLIPSCNATAIWVPGQWSQVKQFFSFNFLQVDHFITIQCVPSKQCGSKGKQKRSIFCQNTLGKKVSKKRCREQHGSKFRPHRKRKCDKTICGYQSCEDIRQVCI